MINICFIANFEKTYFFEAIAEKILEKKKHQIFWLVNNKKQFDKLKLKFGSNNVCLINKDIEKNIFNKNISDKIKLNEILYQDRCLDKNSSKDLRYLEITSLKIYEFLNKNKIKFVYGEITWAHEILTYKICNLFKSLNCKFYNPSTIRFPLNYFLFFKNHDQSEYFLKKNQNYNSTNFVKDYSKEYLDLVQNIRPKNLFKSYNFIIQKIKKLFYESYFDKYDPTKTVKHIRIFRLIKKYINFILFNLSTSKNLEILKNKKYIIYFLQKQPEASIDVKGVYYDDQISNLKNIWRLMPPDFKIVIKEHPNSIGDRSFLYYQKLTQFNNTILINDKSKFENLVSNAFATFSVASTASMQSALLNVPSYTFVKCFFNEIKFSHRISLEDIKNFKNIFDLNEYFNKKMKLKRLFKKVILLKIVLKVRSLVMKNLKIII